MEKYLFIFLLRGLCQEQIGRSKSKDGIDIIKLFLIKVDISIS